MKTLRYLLVIAVALLVQRSSLMAQVAVKLDSLFHVLDTGHTFNGNVLVSEKNKVVYSRSIGDAELNSGKKHTIASAFQIGSVSKTFTAVAILQLVQQHKIQLKDPYIKYFPDFPYPNIHIDQLLTHTSGLPDKEALFFPLIDKDSSLKVGNEDIIPALKQSGKPLAFTPGSEWRYCNIGYALLASLVEKVSGETFSNYLDRHIFGPAGMKDSYLLGSRPADTNRVAGYLVRHHYLGDMESIENS